MSWTSLPPQASVLGQRTTFGPQRLSRNSGIDDYAWPVFSVNAAARGQLLEIADNPPPAGDFGCAVLDAVAKVVPHEGYALIGTDPSNGLRSMMFSYHGVGTGRSLARNEHREHDVNLYRDLARQALPAGVLSASDERGARSPRMRNIIRPAGYTSELRLVLRSEQRVWGALCLFRSDNLRPFVDRDAVAASELGDRLQRVMRRFSTRRTDRPSSPLPVGTAIVEQNDRISAQSDSFSDWMRELAAGGNDDMTSEDLVRIVFDVVCAARRSTTPATACLRAMSGRWVSLQAERLDRGSGRFVATLAPATLHAVAEPFGLWTGLTPRETQLLELIDSGAPTKMLARTLNISTYTVEDHLRAIYRKTGTDGRGDLLATLRTGG